MICLGLIATTAIASTTIAPTIEEYKADINCVIDNSCEYTKLVSEYPNYKILLNEISVRKPIIGCVVQHESGGRNYNNDGTILRGDAGEFGVSQFMWNTFDGFAKKMGFKEAEIKNPTHQLIVMYWAFNHGLEGHWMTLPKCI